MQNLLKSLVLATLLACCNLAAGYNVAYDSASDPAFGQWLQQYPSTPATMAITQTENAANLPKQIALLLPLSGNLSTAAKAVQNGFFAAYYNSRAQGYNPSIRVYDTTNKDINAVYQQAQNEAADFIVGPLVKEDLQTLLSSNALNLPTLALNSVDNNSANNPNLYEFALSPSDEMQQVAKRLWQEQHRHLLVITPSDSWSQKIVNDFNQLWQQFGGNFIKIVSYQQQSQLSTQLSAALNIDQAEARNRTLEKVLQKKLRFLPHRRGDFDAVFFIANNNWARQIVPLLNFYFIGNTAMYSLSQVYPGNIDPARDHDLDQVIFDDMPWILEENTLPGDLNQIRAAAANTWPKNFTANSRLIAFGADAFLLISHLPKLNSNPQFGVLGATGNLYLLPNHHIYRELPFAQFRDGKPIIIK